MKFICSCGKKCISKVYYNQYYWYCKKCDFKIFSLDAIVSKGLIYGPKLMKLFKIMKERVVK